MCVSVGSNVCLCVCRYSSLQQVDTTRLLALINSSFERTLSESYLETLESRLHSIYLSEGSVRTRTQFLRPLQSRPCRDHLTVYVLTWRNVT